MRTRQAPTLAIDACFRAVSVRPLAGLRVGLPLLLLVHLAWVSNDLLSLHGGRGIIPWELTDLLRDPWVPGLPTLARAALPLGIGAHAAVTLLLSCYAGSLLALALGFHARVSALLAWGLHLALRHQRVCVFLWRRSAGQYVPLLSPRLSVRARLDVRVSFGLPPPRGDDSRRLPEGDASAPLRDLSRGRSLQGLGETVVERRGHLASRLSARLSHFDLGSLARHPWIPTLAGWVHAGGGDRLRVSHLATPHSQGVVHRGDRAAPGRRRVHGARLLLGRDDSPDLLPLPDPRRRRSSRSPPSGMRTRRPIQAALLVALCLLPFGLKTRRQTGLPDDFAPIVSRLMARDQIPGVAVGVVERGQPRLRSRLRLPRCRSTFAGDARHALPSRLLLEGFHGTGARAARGRGKDRARRARTHLPARFFPRGPGGVCDRDDAGSAHPSQRATRHDFFWYRPPSRATSSTAACASSSPAAHPTRGGDTTA